MADTTFGHKGWTPERLGDLSGKTYLITGANSGAGFQAARTLLKKNARVVMLNRSTEKSKAAIGELKQEIGEAADVSFVRLDLAVLDSVRDAAAEVLTTVPRIDALINNAAIASYTPFLEMTVKEWDLVMDIDLRAPFIACKSVVPIMIEQGGGSIINISSHAATNIFSSTLSADSTDIALIGQNYGAAKVGLERFTWGLAAELGPYNISVNVLKPLRPVVTEGFLAQRPDADISTWATPADMVKAAKYLAAQDAKGLSGTTVTAEELVRRLGL